MSITTTLFLMEKYGPRMTMEQLGQALGLATPSIHNRIGRGELAIPTYVDGKLRYADTRDVAEYLDLKRQEALRHFRVAA